jgi:hypothetical protein
MMRIKTPYCSGCGAKDQEIAELNVKLKAAVELLANELALNKMKCEKCTTNPSLITCNPPKCYMEEAIRMIEEKVRETV